MSRFISLIALGRNGTITSVPAMRHIPTELKGFKSDNSRFDITVNNAHINGDNRQRVAPHGLSTESTPVPDPAVMTSKAPKKATMKPNICIALNLSLSSHAAKTAVHAGEVVIRTEASEGDR